MEHEIYLSLVNHEERIKAIENVLFKEEKKDEEPEPPEPPEGMIEPKVIEKEKKRLFGKKKEKKVSCKNEKCKYMKNNECNYPKKIESCDDRI